MKSFNFVFPLVTAVLTSCNEPTTPYLRSNYAENELTALCETAITQTKASLAEISELAPKNRTVQNTLLRFESVTADFWDSIQPLTFMGYVSTKPSLRDEGAQCEEKSNQFFVKVKTDPKLYAALASLKPSDPEESRLHQETIAVFKKSGLNLPDDKRSQVASLFEQLASLESEFNAALNNDVTSVELTQAELEGVPDSVLTRLKKTEDGSKYIVSTKRTIYSQIMENAIRDSTRKQLMLAYDNRASSNVALLEQAIAIRSKIASLMGYETWADYKIEGRMAKTKATVQSFLAGLKEKLKIRAKQDLEALTKAKAELGLTGGLEPWDLMLTSNYLKKKDFSLDDEKIREYFPADLVVQGMFKVYSKLLGVTYEEVAAPEGVPFWSSDVKYFRIRDKKTAQTIGYFYADFFPRDGKYGHAAAFTLISGRRIGTQYSKTVSAIVSNFNPPSDGRPSLLNHDEVETLFHEFGHIMHQTLTRARFASLAGSSTAMDFVEAPSQMLEGWVWDPEILGMISGHYQNVNEKLPKTLLDQMLAAKDFNLGYAYIRQLFFGILDLTYHTSGETVDTTAVLNSLYEDIVGLKPLAGGHFQGTFGHLMGGYDSGYYGYLWSEVYAADMFTRFDKEGLLNSRTGADYRRWILEQGNMRDAIDLVKGFLGREPNNKAFLKKLGIKEGIND